MSADDLLSRLSKVRKTSPKSWTACCPAHEDRSPSLAVTESDDGTVLLHCFGGCSVHEVVGALGMELEDLFPPKDTHHAKPTARPFPAADVLRLIAWEGMVVSMTAATMRNRKLTEKETDRMIEAAAKINAALDASGIDMRAMTYGKANHA